MSQPVLLHTKFLIPRFPPAHVSRPHLAHRQAAFSDPGVIHDEDSVEDLGASGRTLRVSPTVNGPLHLEGPFTLASADANTLLTGTDAWLCRCGKSQSKPFCDGSHSAGFEAEGV